MDVAAGDHKAGVAAKKAKVSVPETRKGRHCEMHASRPSELSYFRTHSTTVCR